MKRCIILSVLLAMLIISSCKKHYQDAQIDPPHQSQQDRDETIRKITEKLSSSGIFSQVQKNYGDQTLQLDKLIMYGVLGDTVKHVIIPISNASGLVENFVQVEVNEKDSVADPRLVNYKQDYLLNHDGTAKAIVARDLLALHASQRKLPTRFSVDSAKIFMKVLPGVSLSRKSQQGKNTSARLGGNCSMRFQILYIIMHPNVTPSMVHTAFFNRMDLYLPQVEVLAPQLNVGGFNYTYLHYSENYIDYYGLQLTIAGIWQETMTWIGGPSIIASMGENYIDDGCVPGDDDGGGGGITPVQPVPTDPNPDVCDLPTAEITAAEVLNAGMDASEDYQVSNIGNMYMENGQWTQKKRYKWTFYKGSLLHISWKYKSYEIGTFKKDNGSNLWYWHQFQHETEVREGTTPFTTTLTMNVPPSNFIEDNQYHANVDLDYTVTVALTCGGDPIFSSSKTHSAGWHDISVDFQ